MTEIDKNIPISIFITGHYNTGKSTLFNRIIGVRYASTSGTAHTTKNRRDFLVSYGNIKVQYIDTEGYKRNTSISTCNTIYSRLNVSEKHLILIVVNHRSISDHDLWFIKKCRENNSPVILVVNKLDNKQSHVEARIVLHQIKHYADMCEDIVYLSSKHGNGIKALVEKIGNIFKLDMRPHTVSTKESISDETIIRLRVKEIIFRYFSAEIPHRIYDIIVLIEQHEINISILVSKTTHKVIIDKKLMFIYRKLINNMNTCVKQSINFLPVYIAVKCIKN